MPEAQTKTARPLPKAAKQKEKHKSGRRGERSRKERREKRQVTSAHLEASGQKFLRRARRAAAGMGTAAGISILWSLLALAGVEVGRVGETLLYALVLPYLAGIASGGLYFLGAMSAWDNWIADCWDAAGQAREESIGAGKHGASLWLLVPVVGAFGAAKAVGKLHDSATGSARNSRWRWAPARVLLWAGLFGWSFWVVAAAFMALGVVDVGGVVGWGVWLVASYQAVRPVVADITQGLSRQLRQKPPKSRRQRRRAKKRKSKRK